MPTLQIIAFRGTGGFENPKYASLPALIKAGHVGLKFENDETIYGFHPTSAAEIAAGGEKGLMELLLNHVAQEGSWQDDTLIFKQAHGLSQSGERTKVWALAQEISDEAYAEIIAASKQWYTDDKLRAKYNLPNRDGDFQSGEYNCATFPSVLGVKLPINNGIVAIYIEAMKNQGASEWHPSSTDNA
jgi:filamentous hemagglutinin